MNVLNAMWVEKHRPKNLDEIVGDFKDKIKAYLKDISSMQHLLLHSVVPGTGKTSMAKIIIKELNADSLILNASDDRKIETIREKVTEFVRTKSSKPGMRRVVFMDEADGLTNVSQDALRNLMETYAGNAIFILTCNSLSKINDAIQSRCVKIFFGAPDRTEIFYYLKSICEKENLKYTDEGLIEIISKNYPSIRNCVQVLQEIHVEGKEVSLENVKISDEEFQSLWTFVNDKKDWKSVKDYLFKHDVDITNLNKFFWFKAVPEI